jgi:ADP-ribose pyrophosphatase
VELGLWPNLYLDQCRHLRLGQRSNSTFAWGIAPGTIGHMVNKMQQHGPWTIVERHAVYADPWMQLVKDDVLRPDGEPGTYSVVQLKPGVCVVALDERENVHLTMEFHYGVGRVTLEGVSGGIEEDESAETAARRELAEELGIEAGTLHPMGMVDPFTASVVSPTQLFLAEALKLGTKAPEATEVIQHVSMPLSEAIAAVLDGRITHAPSCVLLLKLEKHVA